MLCTLEDPMEPLGCSRFILAFLHAIDSGPAPLLNQQVLRYNHPDVYTRFTRFLMRKRTIKQQKRTGDLLLKCNCYGDKLITALIGRYSCDRLDTHTHAADDWVVCSHHREPEYVEIRIRAKLEDFLQQLHVFANTIMGLAGSQPSLEEVMEQMGSATLAAIQPLHEGVTKLYNWGKISQRNRRGMWPRSSEELLPYGVEESMFSLGRLSAQLNCCSAMGIAGVIMDVIRGPAIKAFMDSPHFSGAFVSLMHEVLENQKALLIMASGTPSLDRSFIISARAVGLLRDIKRVALVAHMLCVPESDRIRFNEQAKAQSGICDGLEIADRLVRSILNFRFILHPDTPNLDAVKLHKIAEDAYNSYAMLGGALHRRLRRPYDGAVYHPHILMSSQASLSQHEQSQAARSSTATTPEAYAALAMHTYCAVMDFTEIRRCWNQECGEMEMLAGHKFQRCACCKVVRYCSSACQRAAWDTHQAPCKLMRAKKAIKLMDLPVPKGMRFPTPGSLFKLCKEMGLTREDLLAITDYFNQLAAPYD
ncbi:hypothetical protein AURDEDRAFT_143169 [Auricularia subglabra TFB-10046 SS5]|nr:hypothetical protein AURDEDRAFT_143169 [Auricularia subglabra TFB-10046 SS5]